MGWAYWELSGGTSFKPEERPAVAAAATEAPAVTRADTSALDETPAADAAQAATAVPAADPALAAEPATEPATAPAADPEVDAVVDSVLAEETAPVEPADAVPATDLRVVSGDRVNLRDGPGRDFTAIDQLAAGTIAEVIETGADGWVRIQIQGTETRGWMSSDFLIPLNG